MKVTARSPLPTPPTAAVAAIPAKPSAAAPAPAADKQPHTPDGTVAPAAEAPAATTDADPISSKIAALARREKAILDEKKKIDAQKQEFERQREDIRKQAQEELRAQFKQDPFSLMEQEGLTFEQAMDLHGKRPSPEAQQLTALQKQIEQIQKEKVEGQQRQYQAARSQALTDVKQIVTATPEFEVLRAFGLEEEVVNRAEEEFGKSGVLPDYATLCKSLEDEYLPIAIEIAKLGKVKKALAPPADPASAEPTQEQAQKQPAAPSKQPEMTTLSNRQGASSKKSTSWAEHRARLIALAEGKAT